MKILQINNCHYRRGGADVVYLNTTELLQKKEHLVLNFSQKSDSNYESGYNDYFIDEIDFFTNNFFRKLLNVPRFFYSREAKYKLESLLKIEKPDLAHIHLFKGSLTPSILVTLKKYKIPTVISLHDYGMLCPHNLLLDGKENICERCIGNSSLNCIYNKCNRNNLSLSAVSAIEYIFNNLFFPYEKYFTKILTVSKFAYDLHTKSLQKIKSKFEHLYNFFPNLSDTNIDVSKGEYFLFFGRLSKEKGVETLLNVCKKSSNKIKLKIAGTGSCMDRYLDFVQKENLNNIEFLGHVEGDSLTNLIKDASFIIVPSEWYENNPLTVIEAYAYGKPVIASSVGGLPEIVIHKKTGFLFEMKNERQLKDCIEEADNMLDADYEVMSRNARKFAEENFDEEVHYKQLIDIYKSIISEID